MRKYYIDNLRWMCVLLLFPYHILMIYNSFGESFFIKGENIDALSAFIVAVGPWFMPLLFVVAGISTSYALKKRSIKDYIKERITKLLVPLISGLCLLVPAQTYFAERFHNSYTGGYFAQYILFFTKETDLTGYNGGFSTGQFWFVIYLLIISLVSIPIILLARKIKRKVSFDNLPVPVIICLFIVPVLGTFVLDIGGKVLGEYFAYFILGYFILSNENIQKRLEKYRYIFLLPAFCLMIIIIIIWLGIINVPNIVFDALSIFYAWLVILSLLGKGRKHLNFKNKFTDYMSRSSFCVYLFHQSWIIMWGYVIFLFTDNVLLQIIFILLASVITTFALYEICRRFKVTRFLFAIKN